MRRKSGSKIVIGNWKMNPLTLKEAEKLFSGVSKGVSKIKNTEVVVCPPFVYLEKLKKLGRKIHLGAQDAFFKDAGAFTGEVSPEMLYNIGVKYVILGHSERRALGETNQDVNRKLRESLASSLNPILCVGESTRDESHEYFNLVKVQITECLKGVQKSSVPEIIIAYEPIWAISTTKDRRDATAKDSEEMVIYIRKVISDLYSLDIASKTRIVYGGSVNPKDVEEFLRFGGVDGVLVGKASLDAKKFTEIINIAESI